MVCAVLVPGHSHLLRDAYAFDDALGFHLALLAQNLPALLLLLHIGVEVLHTDREQFPVIRIALHRLRVVQQLDSVLFADDLALADRAALEVESLLAGIHPLQFKF